jgi:hypothetical protein
MSGTAKAPVVAMCTYRIKKGKEEEFVGLLRRHWPTLRDQELVENTPSQVFRGTDDSAGTYFVEILTWKDGEMPNRAHELPAVMAVWEPMGMCCEARLGRPAMEFPTVQVVSLQTNDAGRTGTA